MRSRALLVAMAFVAAAASCADPAHDSAVDALGGEKGSPGPTHRPGQPCVVCHGGSGPASAQFSIGGTVFAILGQSDPLVNATVHIEDSSDPPSTQDVTTNSAGNFYIPLSKWAPKYPLKNIRIDCGPLSSKSPYTCGPSDANNPPVTATMNTHVGREGSCAACHFGTPGPTTRGPLYIATDPTDLPGATATP